MKLLKQKINNIGNNIIKIRKWESSFIRDEWGNLKICFWNKMVKEEILKLRN